MQSVEWIDLCIQLVDLGRGYFLKEESTNKPTHLCGNSRVLHATAVLYTKRSTVMQVSRILVYALDSVFSSPKMLTEVSPPRNRSPTAGLDGRFVSLVWSIWWTTPSHSLLATIASDAPNGQTWVARCQSIGRVVKRLFQSVGGLRKQDVANWCRGCAFHQLRWRLLGVGGLLWRVYPRPM